MKKHRGCTYSHLTWPKMIVWFHQFASWVKGWICLDNSILSDDCTYIFLILDFQGRDAFLSACRQALSIHLFCRLLACSAAPNLHLWCLLEGALLLLLLPRLLLLSTECARIVCLYFHFHQFPPKSNKLPLVNWYFVRLILEL
jgi:hypothetical protein